MEFRPNTGVLFPSTKEEIFAEGRYAVSPHTQIIFGVFDTQEGVSEKQISLAPPFEGIGELVFFSNKRGPSYPDGKGFFIIWDSGGVPNIGSRIEFVVFERKNDRGKYWKLFVLKPATPDINLP